MSGASEDSGDEHDSPTEFGYAQLGDGEDAGDGAGEDNNEENQDDEEQVNENSSQQAETVDISGTANGAADSDVQAKPLPPHLDALLDEKEKNSVKKVVKNQESQEEAKKIEEAKKQFEQNYQKEMYSNLPKTQPVELSVEQVTDIKNIMKGVQLSTPPPQWLNETWLDDALKKIKSSK